MDDIIDQAVDITIEHVGKICEDDERMEKVYQTILTPFMTYLSNRFTVFVRAVQCMMSLIVLQTILIMFLAYHARRVHAL